MIQRMDLVIESGFELYCLFRGGRCLGNKQTVGILHNFTNTICTIILQDFISLLFFFFFGDLTDHSNLVC